LNGPIEREPPLPKRDMPVRISAPVVHDGLAAARNREQVYEIAPDGDYALAHSRMQLPTVEQRLAAARARNAARNDSDAAARDAERERADDEAIMARVLTAKATLDEINGAIASKLSELADLGCKQAVAENEFIAIKDEPFARQLRRSYRANELAGERLRRDEDELRELELEERKSAGW